MKEKISRAIEYLENLYTNTYFETEYYKITIKALQEKLNRLEGCEYCTGDVDERFYLIDFGMQLYIDGNNALTLHDTSGDYVDTHINCCSICGRKLRGGEDEPPKEGE